MANSTDSELRVRSTTLETVVTEKQPTLNPDESVQQAGDKMREMDVSIMPVAEGRHLVGVVDQRDPDCHAAGFGHDPKTMTVRTIMNGTVVSCFEDDGCAEALRKMDEHQVDRLPVVDREMRIVGIVNRSDLTERCSPAVGD